MKPFPGFPTPTEATPVPETFFSEVLPEIADLAELKVVLVALRRIRRRKGAVRWTSRSELRAAPELGSLGASDRDAAVAQALAQAVERGVLLEVPLEGDAAYFLNDAEGRRAAELARVGAVSLGVPAASPGTPERAQPPEVADVFRLYEETIGPLPGAGLAEELKEAEMDYPAEWVRDAFREAAAQNVRRWAYVRAILARWREEGRSNEDGTTERRSAQDRYRAGRYGRVVRWK